MAALLAVLAFLTILIVWYTFEEQRLYDATVAELERQMALGVDVVPFINGVLEKLERERLRLVALEDMLCSYLRQPWLW